VVTAVEGAKGMRLRHPRQTCRDNPCPWPDEAHGGDARGRHAVYCRIEPKGKLIVYSAKAGEVAARPETRPIALRHRLTTRSQRHPASRSARSSACARRSAARHGRPAGPFTYGSAADSDMFINPSQ